MRLLKDCTDEIRHLMTTILDDPVIIKPLFMGSGIFYGEFMFAIYINSAFHLKAEGKLAEILIRNGATPWVYAMKGEKHIGTTYYKLPDNIYYNQTLLRKFVLLSIRQMKAKKINSELVKKASIRALPNLTVKHERALAKIGIFTVKELKAFGAIQAFIKIKQSGKDINIAWFWAILAALENKHVHVLTQAEKEIAFKDLNTALAKANMRSIRAAALYNNHADRP